MSDLPTYKYFGMNCTTWVQIMCTYVILITHVYIMPSIVESGVGTYSCWLKVVGQLMGGNLGVLGDLS